MKTLTAIALALSLLATTLSTANAKPRKAKAPESTEVTQAKHDLKIARLRDRIHKAIEACEEEVSIACEDTTLRDHDGGECSDETLRARHAFDVCHPPVDGTAIAKGGK